MKITHPETIVHWLCWANIAGGICLPAMKYIDRNKIKKKEIFFCNITFLKTIIIFNHPAHFKRQDIKKKICLQKLQDPDVYSLYVNQSLTSNFYVWTQESATMQYSIYILPNRAQKLLILIFG